MMLGVVARAYKKYRCLPESELLVQAAMTPNGPAIKCRLCWFGHEGCEQ